MYNEVMKNKFIDNFTTKESTKEFCRRLFNSFEKYEVLWQKDLCTQPQSILVPIASEVSGIKMSSQKVTLTVLKKYTSWCVNNGIPNAIEGLVGVADLGVEAMKYRTVWSPNELQKYLNDVFEPESEYTIDNVYRCYYWLAYGGVKEEDIPKIKVSDVDLENLEIDYNGSKVIIYREALQAIRNCVKLEYFIIKRRGKPVKTPRAKSNTIARSVKGDSSVLSLRVSLSRKSSECIKNGKTNLRLSYYRVWLSGLFYRIREREEIGEDASFEDVICTMISNNIYSSSDGSPVNTSRRNRLINELRSDYNNWKKAKYV